MAEMPLTNISLRMTISLLVVHLFLPNHPLIDVNVGELLRDLRISNNFATEDDEETETNIGGVM